MEATCYWSTLTLHLRTLQEAAAQQVTKQRDIGFIAVNLFIFTSWADTGFPYGLVKGLPAVGYAPPYGIFPQQPARRIGMSEVLEGWQKHNQRSLNQLKPGILQQSMEDAANDFCTPPLRRAEFLAYIWTRTPPHSTVRRGQASNESLTMETQEVNRSILRTPTNLPYAAPSDQLSISAW